MNSMMSVFVRPSASVGSALYSSDVDSHHLMMSGLDASSSWLDASGSGLDASGSGLDASAAVLAFICGVSVNVKLVLLQDDVKVSK